MGTTNAAVMAIGLCSAKAIYLTYLVLHRKRCSIPCAIGWGLPTGADPVLFSNAKL